MPSSNRLLARSQVFFFFSGATGLIYQVLWTRRLTLTFGHTVLAVATVLTAFMAGLALGSMVAGRWTDRPGERAGGYFLGVYGYLEGFIGVWALLTLPLLALAESFYIGLASSGVSGLQLQVACFAAAAVVLVPPTTAMGATVPILTRLLVTQPGEIGPILSRLYGLNTLGALLGAGLGGFLLLPTLGLTTSLVLTALVNGAIAYGALQEAKLHPAPAEPPTPKKAKKKSKKSKRKEQNPVKETSSLGWLVPFTFCLAGFASMAYQVAWNRTLCLSIGSSVYAFSTILVVFLAGLGLGSLLYPRLMRNRPLQLGLLAYLYLGIAISGALTIPGVAVMPKVFLATFSLASGNFLAVIVLEAILVGGLLLLPTFLMGLGFPLATALYASSFGKLGRSVGEVYGANTLGCILGAFLTGFGMIPILGAQWALKVATLVYLFSALVLLLAQTERSPWKGLATVALVCLTVVAWPRWNPGVMASGVGIYTSSTGDSRKNQFKPPALYLEGLSSTVSFHFTGEHWSVPHMRVNGKVDASRGSGDRLTQYFLAYLPCLLHPEPKRVAVIGLGGGFTVEAVAQCPAVETIDCAELEPAVLEAAEYWKPYNSRVLEDERVKIHINDGRTFVLAAQHKYDVLISEPSNPWIAGIGNLFTRDFYARASEQLAENGIMCQWFNIYAVSTEDVRMVLRSFYEVFPQGHVWQSSGGDLIMIGAQQPVPVSLSPFRQAWQDSEAMQRHFFESGLYHPDILAGHYLMDREAALKFAGQGVFNTDDRPLLEFSAPFSLYDREALGHNADALWKASQGSQFPGLDDDAQLRAWSLFGAINLGRMSQVEAGLEQLGDIPEAYLLRALVLKTNPKAGPHKKRLFEECQEKYPDHPLLLAIWGDAAYTHHEYRQAAEVYRRALEKPLPGSQASVNSKLGQALLHLGEDEEAAQALMKSAQLAPTESTALALAGGVYAKARDNEKALPVLKEALKRNPIELVALQNMAVVLFNTGNFKAGEQAMRQFLSLEPGYAPGWRKLGQMRQHLKDIPGSRRAFQRALAIDPQDEPAKKALESLP